jgi:D-hexose-6-phosphate mutarotase
VDQIHPKEWVSKGAPAAYIQQWDSAHTQTDSLRLSSENLLQQPERLTAALDTYFRLQNLEVVLSSLIEGVRKYQNPALADLIRGVISENSSSRQQLRQYVVDLASIKEQEYKVMDQEAQRCRESTSKQPVVVPAKKKTGK